jgi:hypothetical protein
LANLSAGFFSPPSTPTSPVGPVTPSKEPIASGVRQTPSPVSVKTTGPIKSPPTAGSVNKPSTSRPPLTPERKTELLVEWFANNINSGALPPNMKWAQFFPKWHLFASEDDLRELDLDESVQPKPTITQVAPPSAEPEWEEFTSGIHWCGPGAVKKDKCVFFQFVFEKFFLTYSAYCLWLKIFLIMEHKFGRIFSILTRKLLPKWLPGFLVRAQSTSMFKLPLSFCDLFRPVFFSVDYCSLKNLQKFDKGKFWKAVGSCVAPIFVLFQAWGTDDKQSCLAFLKEKGFNVVHTVDQPIQYKGTSFVGDPITQKVCLLIYCF